MPLITYSDVVAAFAAQGLTCSDAEAGLCLNAAIADWESRTYSPFVNSASGDWYFDMPCERGRYEFKTTVFSTVTAVRVGLSPTDTSGTLLVEGTDYELWPYNHTNMDLPVKALVFYYDYYRWPRFPRGMKITGVAGWATTYPDDAWLAIRDMAMAHGLLRVIQGVSTLSEEQQGPVKVQYDTAKGHSKIEIMTANFKATALGYQRIAN